MPRTATPKYRRQRKPKGNDRAFVELEGQRHYLGVYATPESKERHHAPLAEWEANGRTAPVADAADLMVSEVLAAFWQHAERHYSGAGGTPTDELNRFRGRKGVRSNPVRPTVCGIGGIGVERVKRLSARRELVRGLTSSLLDPAQEGRGGNDPPVRRVPGSR